MAESRRARPNYGIDPIVAICLLIDKKSRKNAARANPPRPACCIASAKLNFTKSAKAGSRFPVNMVSTRNCN